MIDHLLAYNPARVSAFLRGLPHTSIGRELTPAFENHCTVALQRLGLAPYPGCTDGQTVLCAMARLSEPDVTPQMLAEVEHATAGYFQNIPQAVRTVSETLKADVQVIFDNPETQIRATEYLIEHGISPVEGMNPAVQVAQLNTVAAKRGVSPAEVARDAGWIQPETPPEQSDREAGLVSTPDPDSWRAHLESAFDRVSKPAQRGKVEKYEAASDRLYHLEASRRRLAGESLDGLEAPPKVRTEEIRAPVAELRRRAGQGETSRDDLEHSWDRIEAAKEGRLEQFEASASQAAAYADDLEQAAETEERAE